MHDTFDFDAIIDRRAVPALKWHPMVLGEDGTDLFPAGVADMDFRAPPVVRDALQARLEHGVFGYEAWPKTLVPALINWLGQRHGWQVEKQQILRAPNVLNVLSLATNVFTNPGDGIIIQPPVFFDFHDIIHENHREILNNPLLFANGRYEIDFAGLAEIAARPNARMLYLCNPHNPVGRVWSHAELAEIDRICRAHDVLVVADEIHGDITFSGHKYTPFASLSDATAANTIAVTSPAKAFNIAACCQAFAIIPDPERRKLWQTESSRLNCNKNNAFSSAAMVAAYAQGAPWLDAVREYLAENLATLRARIAAMDRVDLVEPEGTFLAWIDFRALGLSPDALTQFLRAQAGWAVTRGQSFGIEGAGFARFNFACPHSRLVGALDQLEAALRKAF